MSEDVEVRSCHHCGRSDNGEFVSEDGKTYCRTCMLLVPSYKRGFKPVGRNAKCPCGSNKKFKHCCMR